MKKPIDPCGFRGSGVAGSTENLGFLLNRFDFGFLVAGSALFWAIRDQFSMVPKILGSSESNFEIFVISSGCLSVVSSYFKLVLASLRVSGSGSLVFKSFYVKLIYVLDSVLILVHYSCRCT